MNALETLLRPLAAMLNRQLQAKSPARELCAELDGRVFAVRVRDTSLVMYFLVGSGEITLAPEYDGEPDTVVTGSLLSLAALAGGNDQGVIRRGSIDLSGNPDVAQKFQKLLKYGRPDLEEELSAVIGDVAAHSIGEVVRRTQQWGVEAGATMMQNFSEYLQEESRAVPSRYETEGLLQEIEALRDDVARFEARLKQFDRHLQH
ncbi:MAG: SCP2 sterol-binding domain-containing protein [Woeseiaceae bacterium]|nr:SCP2 sterol-binding domain-containing protein [Woeseiaceae bacterium]